MNGQSKSGDKTWKAYLFSRYCFTLFSISRIISSGVIRFHYSNALGASAVEHHRSLTAIVHTHRREVKEHMSWVVDLGKSNWEKRQARSACRFLF
jgi:hypothetical protein